VVLSMKDTAHCSFLYIGRPQTGQESPSRALDSSTIPIFNDAYLLWIDANFFEIVTHQICCFLPCIALRSSSSDLLIVDIDKPLHPTFFSWRLRRAPRSRHLSTNSCHNCTESSICRQQQDEQQTEASSRDEWHSRRQFVCRKEGQVYWAHCNNSNRDRVLRQSSTRIYGKYIARRHS
jgi:hypothetical protein